jgi:hypothetical protein
MSSVSEDLRPQATACSLFFLHLLGDFPSPFVIGYINDKLNLYWGTIIAASWSVFGLLFWGIAFNISVLYI